MEISPDEESEHDDYCHVCEKVGELLCCDYCSLTFHLGCLPVPLEVGNTLLPALE